MQKTGSPYRIPCFLLITFFCMNNFILESCKNYNNRLFTQKVLIILPGYLYTFFSALNKET